ncbi:MAG: hypothetical protein EP329_16905 [Deltaproteobacteria bacterium]|nr:MAG: hypothetical protein EP329_16905 [Deltaproteobacteria bacterium]
MAIDVAPLSLPGLSDVEYTLTVVANGATVWTKTLRSSAYGDGAGAISYVGTCDAEFPQNTVELVLEALEVGGTPLVAGVDYANPAPTGSPLTLVADCVADQDTPVTFDVTVARAATQGFFDVAVQFEDLFCSAKLDCEKDTGDPLTLLFDPLTGERDLTAVLALACTAGPDAAASTLHLNDLIVTCDDGSVFSVMPDQGPGNLSPSFPGPAPDTTHLFFQTAVFRGEEPLAGAHKAYWNVALGLNADAFATFHRCVLTTRGTATDGALTDGWTRPGAVWPYVDWNVELFSADGATRCTQHGLGDGNGVAIAYTTTAGAQFAVSFAAALPAVTRHLDPVCAGVVCDPNASCVGPVDHCACNTDYVGDGLSCIPAYLESCQAIVDAGLSTGSGTYDIDPDGAGTAYATHTVYCDMSTPGEGWTEITLADARNYFGGTMVAVDGATIAAIDASYRPYTQDSSGDHTYHYTFEFPAGFSEFYLSNYVIKANSGSGYTSETGFTQTSWGTAHNTGAGDISFGDGDAAGPVTSYTREVATFSCATCTTAWTPGSTVYPIGSTATRFRIGWGEGGTQFEGWYPWWSGSIFLH